MGEIRHGEHLSGVRLRGVYAVGLELDTPDLEEGPILVNGVDVAPFVRAELDRRFPGHDLKRATTPEDLRRAWGAVETAWADAVRTADSLPAGSVDVSVEGEWSFAQTLRHLVLATDAWLHGAILGVERPFHPIGQPFREYAEDGFDVSIFREPTSYAEVLSVRAGHVADVRGFLASVTPETLAEQRPNPWSPAHRVTVLACLHVILNEEWEHLRYALRDLAALSD